MAIMQGSLALTTTIKLILSLSGLITYPFLHYAICSFIHWKAPWLEKGRAFRITTSTVSGLQSLVVVAISARAVIMCKDIINDEDIFIHAFIWFAVSYFPYDIIVMYIGSTYANKNKKLHIIHGKSFLKFFKKETVMVLHHVIFLTAGFPIAEFYKKQIGDFFLCCFLLAEASTPFYSARCIFKELEIRSGWFYVINGLLFLVVFLFCRVLSTPLMFLRYSYYANIPFMQVPFNIPFKCTAACTVFFLLQFHWFRLICLAAKNHVFKKGKSNSLIVMEDRNLSKKYMEDKQCGSHLTNGHLKTT